MAELIQLKRKNPRRAPRAVYKNEDDVKDEVKRVLGLFGEKCYWLMPSANMYGSNEKHDFHIVLNGYGGTIETKFGNNKMSEGQSRCYDRVVRAGGFSFLIDEKNISGLYDALRLACDIE